ncbi:MgtC/SapB family protein [Chitinophaga silvatica]|uniref:MgtC/SapB family protein n=1 Tax=Chitinophaga silvatica TaxID=2282649 RepID=A0A3E1Y341_9BACT|nr:MgtC/SapB family protein [Chitinophaga silvatica]RFS19098.1 MgtC/SapB family protein [Chitinophaga silvatica]
MRQALQIIEDDQLLKVLIALVMGAILGVEREYKRKAAGMRTMTLICMSSAVFTILSAKLGFPGSPDRVASNILTGVGFIGAGVIFKNDYTIDGITTAASIWIASAIGMAVGMSNYLLAVVALAGSLGVLIILEFVEKRIAEINDKRLYTIYFYEEKAPHLDVEKLLQQFKLKHRRILIVRKEKMIEVNYEVRGSRQKLEQLDEFLLRNNNIFQYQVHANPL